MRALVFVLAALPMAAHAVESFPVQGDVRRGAGLYRVNCAACHGATGKGDGFMAKTLKPAPGPARGAPLLVGLTDANLADVIRNGGPALEKSTAMPAFGVELSELETWDLIAYLRQGAPGVLDFFPNGARYIVKSYTLDQYAQERLGKAGIAKDETPVEVVTVFNGDRQPGMPAALEPQDPVTLDSLKPKDRIGYVAFVDAQLPKEKAASPVAIAMDRDGKIVKALSLDGDPARDKVLATFVGQGKKGPHAPLAPAAKGKKAKAPADGEKLTGFDAAYARAEEAVTQYDKEERDRTWADAPSK